MPKNILIFSDGTGQAGGVRPDQRLSNVYKLYRATRSGPDSGIDPSRQVAFYDAGLGTDLDVGAMPFRIYSFLRKLIASITGTGLTRNIIECYENIVRVYEPGDRIYLFGFSRGAYTVRSVANVLSLCGVPTTWRDGRPLRTFGRELRSVAAEAVKSVYEYGAGTPSGMDRAAQAELARRFRATYGSDANGKANVVPHFIGVFDTVAALGMPNTLRWIVFAGLSLFTLVVYWVIASVFEQKTLASLVVLTAFGAIGVAAIGYFIGRLRFARDFPNLGDLRVRVASWRPGAYDLRLDPDVRYARHALAIDERRKDFPRVGWGKRGDAPPRARGDAEWFIQLWFPGCHSDIGGSYAETESRLSDLSLSWMLGEATSVVDPLIYDESKLHLFPDAVGVQHCEIRKLKDLYPSWWPEFARFSWPAKDRTEALGSPMHESVAIRFEAAVVRDCGAACSYRPATLRKDPRFRELYEKE